MPYGLKQFLKAAAALVSALFVSLVIYLMHASSFSGGESVYYLCSASSQADVKAQLSFADLARLKGESAVYVFERTEGGFAGDAAVAEEIMRKYRAELCFTEDVCGTLSYYCYSPLLKGGIELNGRKINLHIAVREDALAVGSPIIFGGY